MTATLTHLISNGTLLGQADFDPGAGAGAAAGATALVLFLIYAAIFVAAFAGLWKMFTKAGKPGWAAIIPIYNIIVVLEIIGKPIWWIILFFIPCVQFVIPFIVFIELAKVFGKGAGFGIAMVFFSFICFPILGFGNAQYTPPTAAN